MNIPVCYKSSNRRNQEEKVVGQVTIENGQIVMKIADPTTVKMIEEGTRANILHPEGIHGNMRFALETARPNLLLQEAKGDPFRNTGRAQNPQIRNDRRRVATRRRVCFQRRFHKFVECRKR